MGSTVRDVMTTPVVTVRPDTPFKQLVTTVRAVGAVPVTDDSGRVLGIVCEHDLLAERCSWSARLAGRSRRGLTAGAAKPQPPLRPA
jgi:CBS-domain-containing membrane protein